MTAGGAPACVLDTNVLVSALVFRSGPPAELRNAWRVGRFVPLGTRTTTAELLRVLAYPKFRLPPAQQDQLLQEYLPFLRPIVVDETAPAAGLPDAADAPFVRAARGAGVVLVSGDRALLQWCAMAGVAAEVPLAFLRRLDVR